MERWALATYVAAIDSRQETGRAETAARGSDRSFGALLACGLTLFALAVDGYHPYAEDGGLYAAGVKWLLDPALYPHGREFVLEPMRLSLFAPAVAGMVRLSGLGLPAVLLALHLASVWATLFAAWMLAGALLAWAQRAGRCGGAAGVLADLAGGGNGVAADGPVSDGAKFFHALHGAGAGGNARFYRSGMGRARTLCGGGAGFCCAQAAWPGRGGDASADGGVCAGDDADAGLRAVGAAQCEVVGNGGACGGRAGAGGLAAGDRDAGECGVRSRCGDANLLVSGELALV